ncbi:hypothetical protein DFP72DRAFT_886056, partial [Ephemerocybe angulata]
MLGTSSGQSRPAPFTLQAHTVLAGLISIRSFKQSHPNSLHTSSPHHSHRQAQLIKPLAGSISVVISRSRHRHGCQTTDHSRTRHPNWDIYTFCHSTDGISPSGRRITKETTGGVARPRGPPISSSQLPVSDVPCSDLGDRNRVHARLRNCPLR